MSIIEILIRIFAELRPLLPAMLVAVFATTAAFTALLLLTRDVWVQDRRFYITGLFFGLDRTGSLKLACAWLKLLFLVVFIVAFRKLNLLSYMALMIPGALGAACGRGLIKKLSDLMWLVLQLMGLVSANLICGYIQEMAGGPAFVLLYVVMGLFLILFSIYLFLNEINAISAAREITAAQVWQSKE